MKYVNKSEIRKGNKNEGNKTKKGKEGNQCYK